jgi:hypothetical protein
MAEELVEEWRKFSLTEAEAPGLMVEDDAMGDSKHLGSHCLLGKMLTDRLFNKKVMKSTMLRIWGLTRGIIVKDIGENLFVFQFTDASECEWVLNGTPWLFDNHLLALNDFDGSCPANQIQFTNCWFWVQLHGIPLLYMTKQTGERVGNAIGLVKEVDVPESGVGWGPWLWVRIKLDITKPFPRGRLITFKSLGQMWVDFKYERMPWICFHCGRLGHLERDCRARLRDGATRDGESKQYGPWLRAAEISQRRRCVMGGERGLHPPSVVQPREAVRGAKNLVFENTRSSDISASTNDNSQEKMQDSEESGSRISRDIEHKGIDEAKEDLVANSVHVQGITGQLASNGVQKEVLHATDNVAMGKVGAMQKDKFVEIKDKCYTFVGCPSVLNLSPRKGTSHEKVVKPVIAPQNKKGEVADSHVKSGGPSGEPSVEKKKAWKRLARAKGKSPTIGIEGPKRDGEVIGSSTNIQVRKRSKLNNGLCLSNNSLSAEAVVQPRRHQ